jgi:dTDP-4-dehydrorhamnose reductase
MTVALIFGRTGQLATGLARTDWPAGWRPLFVGRDSVDLTEPAQAAALIARIQPGIVINAAAYTAVDKAESEPELARTINALSPEAMAKAAANRDIPFITLSTDYVFDGSKLGEYLPSDATAPLNVYGTSKEEGEQRVRAVSKWHVILRTSWVFSAWTDNFVRTMLRYGAERLVMRIVDDQYGKPTAATDLAAAVIALAVRMKDDQSVHGTYHFSNDGITSWYGFADAIFAGATKRGARVPEEVIAITTKEYPTPARRPINSVLSTTSLIEDFCIIPRPWQAALEAVLDELLSAKGG